MAGGANGGGNAAAETSAARAYLIDRGMGHAASLIKWGIAAYVTIEVVSMLAGKSTRAQFVLQALVSSHVSCSIAILFGLAGTGWGAWNEREKRRRTKRMGSRVKELEEKVDPNRSSSGLMEDGTTRPGDKP